jgi:hypothetical protein
VHEHNADAVCTRERRFGIRCALLRVVEAADPDIVVRCRKPHVFVDQDSHAGVGEAPSDVDVVSEEVVVSEDGELAEWRLDSREQRHEAIDISGVEGHKVAAEQEQIRFGVGERVAGFRDQPRIGCGSSMQIGRERDADRRCRAPCSRGRKRVRRDAERALEPEPVGESRRPRSPIREVIPDLRDAPPRRQVPRAAEPAWACGHRSGL